MAFQNSFANLIREDTARESHPAPDDAHKRPMRDAPMLDGVIVQRAMACTCNNSVGEKPDISDVYLMAGFKPVTNNF